MDLDIELAELRNVLAEMDFAAACLTASQSKHVRYLIVKVLRPIKIKIDGNTNHKRPHVHIDYGRQYHAASYAIDTGERIVGDSKYDHEVYEWILKNRSKLLRAWELVQVGNDATSLVCELRGE